MIALGQFKPELEIDFDASMKSLTQTGSNTFNATVAQQVVKDGVLASTENCNKNLKQKDSKGIHYYSWTGVAQATNALDIDTVLMQLGPLSYGSKDNDGMVSRCSAFMGKVIHDQYKLNHTPGQHDVWSEGYVCTRSGRPLSPACQPAQIRRFITPECLYFS